MSNKNDSHSRLNPSGSRSEFDVHRNSRRCEICTNRRRARRLDYRRFGARRLCCRAHDNGCSGSSVHTPSIVRQAASTGQCSCGDVAARPFPSRPDCPYSGCVMSASGARAQPTSETLVGLTHLRALAIALVFLFHYRAGPASTSSSS
jgi:hypothetical protein